MQYTEIVSLKELNSYPGIDACKCDYSEPAIAHANN